MPEQHLIFSIPSQQLPYFNELVQAWRARHVRVTIACHVGPPPDARCLLNKLGSAEAVLIAGSSRRAPSTVLPGPFVEDRNGRRVPVAWLPLRTPDENRRFAATAARVHRRPAQQVAVALLGQWHPRYLRVTDRIETLLCDQMPTLRWTADVIGREDMVQALGSGLGLGLYVGHGRPVGWVGYHGTRRHHFDAWAGEPLGALISLCCRTASRQRTSLSYAEAVPLRGVAAASFGAFSDTLHTDNTRWALGLCDALRTGAQTIGELIVRGAPPVARAWESYRLIGDPLAPLASECLAVARAAAVPVYP
ncbi:C25 family cysteine peptidase [Nitrosospira briensis]|uniref:C25 family cysteine peptidase n=1 Tax=Nitrosospira briensis TaxID=35799 RepID=UPI00094321F4|nr:C25 family cysteine peptidase [Nitrosospira briensis]